MAGNKRLLGAQKERAAEEYLKSRGFRVIDRNFSCRQGEIDLIAVSPEKELAFIEVKYRSGVSCGLPEEAVDRKKQRRIQKTARYYLFCHGCPENTPCRYDVVCILGNSIKLYENAFGYF